MLPLFLKTQLALFIYQEAIQAVPFLQHRPQLFYLTFLEKLVPVKFREGTLLLKEKTKSEEIFLILKGEVLNETTQRMFYEGSIIGETDIYYDRDRTENYIALTKVYTVKYDSYVFKSIMKSFPMIEEEIGILASHREKLRKNKLRQRDMLQ
mmetsp:Transcript_44415/g.43086  ORF Transcript_44415/g.43086 Transcript_44415/m.43086 type:complete len:152 (-) Transcript_44415:1553-2008(-)